MEEVSIIDCTLNQDFSIAENLGGGIFCSEAQMDSTSNIVEDNLSTDLYCTSTCRSENGCGCGANNCRSSVKDESWDSLTTGIVVPLAVIVCAILLIFWYKKTKQSRYSRIHSG